VREIVQEMESVTLKSLRQIIEDIMYAGKVSINPNALNPQPSTLNPQPSTLNPTPSILHPTPYTPKPKPEIRKS